MQARLRKVSRNQSGNKGEWESIHLFPLESNQSACFVIYIYIIFLIFFFLPNLNGFILTMIWFYTLPAANYNFYKGNFNINLQITFLSFLSICSQIAVWLVES